MKTNFYGHVWIEDSTYGLIIDTSIPDLPHAINIINKAMRIPDEPLLLDVSRTVIKREELVSDSVLRSPVVGYHYSKPNNEITKKIKEHLSFINELNFPKAA